MVMLLADRLASTVAPASAASPLGGLGTQTSSQISAWTIRPRRSSAANSRSVPNGDAAAGDRDGPAVGAVAGDEVARLVELAVVRQVDFRHHAEQRAAMDGQGAVVERAQMPQRRADQQQRQQVGGGCDDGLDRGFDRVEQGGLLQQVADRVAGNAEFRKHRHAPRPGGRSPAPCGRIGLRVGRRIGQRGAGGAGGDTGEAVTVE